LQPEPVHGGIAGAHRNSNLVIVLKRRNWENHGTDTTIDRTGKYSLEAVFLGKTKRVREGTLTQAQLEDLTKSVESANFFVLPDEYDAPFKTPRSWWGYELRIQVDDDSKSVRFHSEDEKVPDPLKRLVEKITELTK
jgi:hypothetical protein